MEMLAERKAREDSKWDLIESFLSVSLSAATLGQLQQTFDMLVELRVSVHCWQVRHCVQSKISSAKSSFLRLHHFQSSPSFFRILTVTCSESQERRKRSHVFWTFSPNGQCTERTSEWVITPVADPQNYDFLFFVEKKHKTFKHKVSCSLRKIFCENFLTDSQVSKTVSIDK